MNGCAKIDDLLLEGDAASLSVAARHAETCPACAEKLADWNEIGQTARSLHTTWQSDLLWPRIERSLKRPPNSAPRLWQAAAAILLTVGLGAGGWFALHVRARHSAFDATILREQAVMEVEQAERTHLAAIRRLEAVTADRLEDPATPLMVSYREKLMLLDEAIDDCQTSIRQNRQNAHLRKQLLAVYSEKQKTLEDVLQEENTHVSNQ